MTRQLLLVVSLWCPLLGCGRADEPEERPARRDDGLLIVLPSLVLEESTEVAPPPAPSIPRLALEPQISGAATLSDAATASWGLPIFSLSPITLEGGVLTLRGTSGADVAAVSIDRLTGTLRATVNRTQVSSTRALITKIVFTGGDGDDTFTNATDLPCTANGGDGNDTLQGGTGDDFLVGGYGQDTLRGDLGDDTLWGSGGSDLLFGDDGEDVLFGHGGADQLNGGSGRDTLNGGSGNDTLSGDSGQDLLVSVGGGTDTLTGGYQWDNFWVDASDTITDPSANETTLGYVHVITSFRAIGGAAVGLEAMGEDLPDPAIRPSESGTLQDFSSYPLFASAGPSKDDVFQGSTGDCYFMARLTAFADADPEFIRKAIAPLGDGSYAVRFVRNGVPDYVRVDSDLWVKGDGTLVYAKEGQEGALWVPLIEKAFAVARRDQNSYASINGGNGTTLSTLPHTTETTTIDDGLTDVATLAWFNQGQPGGAVKTTLTGSVKLLLLAIDAELDSGSALITGARSGLSNATPIQLDDPATDGNESTYRRGQHIYMIDHVEFDANANPTALVLRDPYGSYRTVSDPVRIHFCIGRATKLNF
ncbi:MAG: C2 family cysteine protease [Myxococcota bacterium]